MVGRTADLQAAQHYSQRLLLIVGSRLTVLMAGHEHKACEPETGGMSVVMPISVESKALRMCIESLLPYALQCLASRSQMGNQAA